MRAFCKQAYFVLYDNPQWNLREESLSIQSVLCVLNQEKGVLFWCRDGEWRAVGGSHLATVVEHTVMWERLRKDYVVHDTVPKSWRTASFNWDAAIPVPAELVRWLRDEAEQLGETDTTAESPTKGNPD